MKFASKLVFMMMVVLILISFSGIATAANAEQQSQFSTPIMIVNSSFLNVRTGPGVRYEVLITVVGGTDLPVLGVANDRVWYQVSTVVGVGWINSEFVVPRGDFTNIPVVDTRNLIANSPLVTTGGFVGLPDGQGGGGAVFPTTTITTTGATSFVGGATVAGTDANGNPIIVSGPGERFRAILLVPAVDLRTAPGDNQPTVGTLYQDSSADYPIVGDGRDSMSVPWFSVITPRFGTGWVDSPKISLRLSAVAGTVMVVVADSIQLGDGPGTGSSRLPVLTHGVEGWLRNISQDSNFIQLELAGGELGWVPFSAVETRTGTPTDGLDFSNLSFAPGVVPGTSVTTTTTVVRPTISLSTARVIVNTAFLNIRSGPGAQYTSVATVSGGAELLVLGIAKDRVWYLVEGRFGRGWLNSEFTIFRGVMDNVPIINPDALVGALVQQAIAIISAPTTLYAAPGTNFGSIGVLSPPAEVIIVARTADNTWVQLNTQLGFGWALSSQILIQGDLSTTPIVG